MDCIDVSDFNSVFDTNYDPKELDAIKQQNFTDAHVSFNGFETGYWKLPCTIPLLPDYSSLNNVRVIPCVRKPSTTLATTTKYHFVTPHEEFFEMTREGEYRLSNINLKYVRSVEFPVLETFTQSTIFKPCDSLYPATIQIVYDDEKQKDIGKITLKDDDVYFDIVSPNITLLGRDERQFWEISYKSSNGRMYARLNFEGGIILFKDMAVMPSTKEVWKKLYIDITEIVRQASYTALKISVSLEISGIRDDPDSVTEFYFENIKLITMDAPYD